MEHLSLHFAVEKKKETITESAGRQQKKKIGKVRRGVQCPRNMEKVTFPPFEAVLELVLSMAAGSWTSMPYSSRAGGRCPLGGSNEIWRSAASPRGDQQSWMWLINFSCQSSLLQCADSLWELWLWFLGLSFLSTSELKIFVTWLCAYIYLKFDKPVSRIEQCDLFSRSVFHCQYSFTC